MKNKQKNLIVYLKTENYIWKAIRMRILEDETAFSKTASTLRKVRGDSFCYTTERHETVTLQYPSRLLQGLFLFCSAALRMRLWNGDHQRRINMDFLTVGFVHSGSVFLRVGPRCFVAEPGEIYLLPPHCDYEYLTKIPSERSALLIAGAGLDGILSKSGLLEQLVFPLENPDHFYRYFQEIGRSLSNAHTRSGGCRVSSLCYELLQDLSMPVQERRCPENLERVLLKMESDPEQNLPISLLSEMAGVSPAGLTRLFREHLQTSPHRYLVSCRMKRAEELLSKHMFSIKEIAQRVGYENPLNFSTEFRKYFGASPKKHLRFG